MASSADRFVSSEFRRNVYLTVKEALHNIVKHSEAREVHIGITVDKELAITITDNGIGFGLAGAQHPGNGLGNMYRRVRAIGGQTAYLLHVKIDSSNKMPYGNAQISSLLSYYNRFDYGFGGGVEIHPIAGLLIGGRYNISLSNLYKQAFTTMSNGQP